LNLVFTIFQKSKVGIVYVACCNISTIRIDIFQLSMLALFTI
jgi:hypothetical protein